MYGMIACTAARSSPCVRAMLFSLSAPLITALTPRLLSDLIAVFVVWRRWSRSTSSARSCGLSRSCKRRRRTSCCGAGRRLRRGSSDEVGRAAVVHRLDRPRLVQRGRAWEAQAARPRRGLVRGAGSRFGRSSESRVRHRWRVTACARPTFAALSLVLSVVLSDVAVCMCMCACTMDPGGRWRGRGVG